MLKIFRKLTLCRIGWHNVYLHNRDIDFDKPTLPAHCVCCDAQGILDTATGVFTPATEAQQAADAPTR